MARFVAGLVVLLGTLCVLLRLDGPVDGTDVSVGWAAWHVDGVRIDATLQPGSGLLTNDKIVAVDGHALADGPVGGRALADRPVEYLVVRAGQSLDFLVYADATDVPERMHGVGGQLVFACALTVLVGWLAVRRPTAPILDPLLIGTAGLSAAVMAALAGLTVWDVATAGLIFWLYHAGLIVGASVGWGAALVLALTLLSGAPRSGARRVAYLGPPVFMTVWTMAVVANGPRWLTGINQVHIGMTIMSATSLVAVGVLALLAFRAGAVPAGPLRWVVAGGALSGAMDIVGWLLPELVLGDSMIRPRWVGLAALPSVAGVFIAILKYQLFSITKIWSRSVVFALVAVVLMATNAGFTALLNLLLPLSGRLISEAAGTVVVALLVNPVHDAVRRLASRLLRHDDPSPGD